MPELKIAADIETTSRHLACVGIAWSKRDSICIPIMDGASNGTNYWTAEQELAIVLKIRELLTHPNVRVVWQNGAYDLQHFVYHHGYMPRIDDDTMLAQHTLFPGEPKSLDFLASIYCEFYQYWKDELKDYRKLPDDTTTFWTYNCKDTVITYEISEVLESLLRAHNLTEQYQFLLTTDRLALRTMIRGILVDESQRSKMAMTLFEEISLRQAAIDYWVGRPLNIGSPKQMTEFFYDELGQKPVIGRKTGNPTCDADALETIANREVLLRPLVKVINELRTLGVFLSTFVQMPLDEDGRMRCSYNVGGTETFRLSSSKNAFGNGGNLQNIPRNHEED